MSNESITADEFRTLAQSRSKFYGFLSSLFVRTPNEELVTNLLGEKLLSFLPSISNSAEIPDEMKQGLGIIQAFIRSTKDNPRKKLLEELGVDWTRLFRGLKPGYGPPPPYESVYASGSSEEGEQGIGAVLRTYREAGVDIGENTRERPDYIGIELDFMRFMTEKEMEAWKKSDSTEAIKCLRIENDFLTKHTKWIPKFCDKVLTEAQTDFYRGIARLTKGFLSMEEGHIEAYIDLVETNPNFSA